METHTPQSSIPLSLKVVMVLLVLWAIGSVMVVPTRFEMGVPFLGFNFVGYAAAAVVILLDILAPLVVVYGTLKRQVYGLYTAYAYMGVFLLNSAIVFMTMREDLGLMPILIPALITAILLFAIHSNRNHYVQ